MPDPIDDALQLAGEYGIRPLVEPAINRIMKVNPPALMNVAGQWDEIRGNLVDAQSDFKSRRELRFSDQEWEGNAKNAYFTWCDSLDSIGVGPLLGRISELSKQLKDAATKMEEVKKELTGACTVFVVAVGAGVVAAKRGGAEAAAGEVAGRAGKGLIKRVWPYVAAALSVFVAAVYKIHDSFQKELGNIATGLRGVFEKTADGSVGRTHTDFAFGPGGLVVRKWTTVAADLPVDKIGDPRSWAH